MIKLLLVLTLSIVQISCSSGGFTITAPYEPRGPLPYDGPTRVCYTESAGVPTSVVRSWGSLSTPYCPRVVTYQRHFNNNSCYYPIRSYNYCPPPIRHCSPPSNIHWSQGSDYGYSSYRNSQRCR